MRRSSERGESEPGRESRERKHWEHPCENCEFKGGTEFTQDGTVRQMDVYSCDDHTQPGTYGGSGLAQQGRRIVVRYGESTRDSRGEISYPEGSLDLETLRRDARSRGSSNHTAPQIAIGKVL